MAFSSHDIPLEVNKLKESPAPGGKPVSAVWRLEWQQRGGRPAEDWIAKTGLKVEGEDGVIVPMHCYLRATLQRLVTQLSQISVAKEGRCDVRSLTKLVDEVIDGAWEVCKNPIARPACFAERSASTMLWGNFCDAFVAVVDLATETKPRPNQTLCIDDTTLLVVGPRNYASIRAKIEGAKPMRDVYKAKESSQIKGDWVKCDEDGDFTPTFLGRLMNALNCRFPGEPSVARYKIKAYIRTIALKFTRILGEFDCSLREVISLSKYRTI
jgi:hypothetical protein